MGVGGTVLHLLLLPRPRLSRLLQRLNARRRPRRIREQCHVGTVGGGRVHLQPLEARLRSCHATLEWVGLGGSSRWAGLGNGGLGMGTGRTVWAGEAGWQAGRRGGQARWLGRDGGGTAWSLRTKLVSPRNRSSTCVAQRWPASRMRPAELTWPSRVSHSSDAKRGEPALSGRKRMPHSTQPCCSEISLSAAGSTVSSAPQKPRHLRRIGSSAPPEPLGRDESIFCLSFVSLRAPWWRMLSRLQ